MITRVRSLDTGQCFGLRGAHLAHRSPSTAGSRPKRMAIQYLLLKAESRASSAGSPSTLPRRTLSCRAQATGTWWAAQGGLAGGIYPAGIAQGWGFRMGSLRRAPCSTKLDEVS